MSGFLFGGTVPTGTVTSVSVVSANGFAGTVATATTTPAITLTTTVTGILSGNGTAISAASTTGTGAVVLATSPSLVTPDIGAATGTSLNLSGLTASQAVVTDGSKNLASLAYATAATASTLAQRDGNGNLVVNNLIATTTSTASAGGTTVMTPSGARLNILTGVLNQTYQLPNANASGMAVGATFEFNNNSTGTLTVTDHGGTTVCTLNAGGYARVVATDVSSANGVWDKHYLMPANASYGTAGLVVTGTFQATGHVTLEGVTSTGATGTGNLVFSTSPVLTTPTLGVATATSVNKVAITAPATSATLTIADGKTLTASNTLTLAGTDSTTMTFPSTSATIARTDAGQTFTGVQSMTSPDITTSLTTPSTTFSLVNATATTVNFAGAATTMAIGAATALVTVAGNIINTSNAITASGNAATVPITHRISTVTNNSAATLTITMTTTSAVDGQMVMVRVLDATAAAQTITWVNTENSTVSAPTTSNGSTTLPVTVGFQYNAGTSKWRCIASA